MKTITYDLKIKVEVQMPNDESPRDAFVDLNYEFYPPNDDCEIIDTDIYDMEITRIQNNIEFKK